MNEHRLLTVAVKIRENAVQYAVMGQATCLRIEHIFFFVAFGIIIDLLYLSSAKYTSLDLHYLEVRSSVYRQELGMVIGYRATMQRLWEYGLGMRYF